MGMEDGIRKTAESNGYVLPAWRMILAQLDPDESARRQYLDASWADVKDARRTVYELAKIAAKALSHQHGESAALICERGIGVRLDALDIARREQFQQIVNDPTRR